MKANGPRLEQAIDARLAEIRDIARSGQTTLTGKTVVSRDSALEETRSRRFRGMRTSFPELGKLPERDTPQILARAVERGKGKVYARLRAAVRRELEPHIKEAKTRRERPTVPAHGALRAKCETCKTYHGKGQHRFHGKDAFHKTHLFSFGRNAPVKTEIRYRYSSRGRAPWLVYVDGKFVKSFRSRAEAEAFMRKLEKENKNPRSSAGRAGSKAGRYSARSVKRTVQRMQPKRGLYRSNPSVPPDAVVIYGRCLRIEAQKTQAHACDPKCARADHCYFHDFKKGAIIYGLPNGDILIKNSRRSV